MTTQRRLKKKKKPTGENGESTPAPTRAQLAREKAQTKRVLTAIGVVCGVIAIVFVILQVI